MNISPFNHSLRLVGVVACLSGIFVVSSRADILFLSNDAAWVSHYSSNGTDLGRYGQPNNVGRSGVAFDNAGNLYVGYYGDGNSIQEVSSSGTFLGVFVNTAAAPRGIAFDGTGNLFVAEDSGIVEKYSATGTDLGTFASGLIGPGGLAFDGAGNLFVADYGNGPANTNNNAIREFSPNGTLIGGFATSGLKNPIGLAFDRAGNLYVANYNQNGTGGIERFAPNGTESTFVTVVHPTGIAFDSAGNLYVPDNGSSKIEKFSATGADLGVFVASPNDINGPEYIAFTDDSGHPLQVQPAAVPEPATWMLVAIGTVIVSIFPLFRRIRTATTR